MKPYDQPPPSPCTNECVIDYTVGWCRACYRTLREITMWSSMTAAQKREVILATESRRASAE